MFESIFLVDDDRTSNFLNKKILKNIYKNVDIIDFISSEEALGHLTSKQYMPGKEPDVVLLDINMPDIDGWEFIERLKTVNKAHYFKIIMLSSSIDENDMDKAKRYKEVKGFITKPLRVDVLERFLQQ